MPICDKNDCTKKIKLTDWACKCGNTYCSKHRYAQDHNCKFDYKNEFNKDKIIENMKCVSKKIKTI